jgi:hypothetical protein
VKSCEVINFKNGFKIILSEKMYKEKYLKETPKEDVESEEHWFDMNRAIEKYPDVDLIE